MTSFKKQLLGQILLERNMITQSQLKKALELQKTQGGYIGELLVSLGAIDEHDMVVALVVQCHIPYIAIDKYEIEQSVIQLVPLDIAVKYHVIPLDRVNKILSIVMANPLDTVAKAQLQKTTRCRLAPFIAARMEIEKAISRWYNVQQ